MKEIGLRAEAFKILLQYVDPPVMEVEGFNYFIFDPF